MFLKVSGIRTGQSDPAVHMGIKSERALTSTDLWKGWLDAAPCSPSEALT